MHTILRQSNLPLLITIGLGLCLLALPTVALEIYCEYDPDNNVNECNRGGGSGSGGGINNGPATEFGELLIDAPAIVNSGDQFQVNASYDPGTPFSGILEFNDLADYISTLIDDESSWEASRGEHIVVKPVFRFSDSVTELDSDGEPIGTTTLISFLDGFTIGETQPAKFTTEAAVVDEYVDPETGRQYDCGDYGIHPPQYYDADNDNSYFTIPESDPAGNYYQYARSIQDRDQALRDWTLRAPTNTTDDIQYYRVGVEVDHRYRHTQYNCEYFLRWTGLQDGDNPGPPEQNVQALPLAATFDIAVRPESTVSESEWQVDVTARPYPAGGVSWQDDELTVDASVDDNFRVQWRSERLGDNRTDPYTCTANYDASNLGSGLTSTNAGEDYFALESPRTYTVTCVDDNDPSIYLSDSVTVYVNPYDVQFSVETSTDGSNWSDNYSLLTDKTVSDLYIRWDTNDMNTCYASWAGGAISLDGTYQDDVDINNVAGAQSYNITCYGRDGNTYTERITHDRYSDELETVALTAAADYALAVDFEACVQNEDESIECTPEELDNLQLERVDITIYDADSSGFTDLQSASPPSRAIRTFGTDNGDDIIPWLSSNDTITFTVTEDPDPDREYDFDYQGLRSPDGSTAEGDTVSCTLDQLFNDGRCVGVRQASAAGFGQWLLELTTDTANAQVRNPYTAVVARFVRSSTPSPDRCSITHFRDLDRIATEITDASPGDEIRLEWETENAESVTGTGQAGWNNNNLSLSGTDSYTVTSDSVQTLDLNCFGSDGVRQTETVTITLPLTPTGNDEFDLEVQPTTTTVPGVTGYTAQEIVITVNPEDNYTGSVDIDVDTSQFNGNLTWSISSGNNPIVISSPNTPGQLTVQLELENRVSRGSRTITVTATDLANGITRNQNVDIDALNLIDGTVTEQ